MANPDERLKLEIALIEKNHFLTIKQLAQEVNASEMSIRRDLSKLEKMNMVKLVYGGVTPAKNSSGDDVKYSLESEQNKNTELKRSIVQRAIQFLEPNDVVFLDSGTTIQMFAEQIPKGTPYTIITSSFNTLEIIIKLPECTVISSGGVFSRKPLVFYDLESANFIRKYRANKAFIGATGYELELGLTCGYLEDAPLKQAMIGSSKYRILLADSTKFGKVSTCMFAKISDFSVVITDSGIPEEYAKQIRANNVELIIV
jgi:DeoR family deoxyribose operon repressor